MCWQLLANQVGQTLAEYAMILSLIAAVLIVSAVVMFRDNIVSAFNGVTDCIQETCLDESPPHCNDDHGNDGNQVPCT